LHDVRVTLGLDRFASAARTPAVVVAAIMGPALRSIPRVMGRVRGVRTAPS
jgi:hypothetical protein